MPCENLDPGIVRTLTNSVAGSSVRRAAPMVSTTLLSSHMALMS
jgi:hypothetical protein